LQFSLCIVKAKFIVVRFALWCNYHRCKASANKFYWKIDLWAGPYSRCTKCTARTRSHCLCEKSLSGYCRDNPVCEILDTLHFLWKCVPLDPIYLYVFDLNLFLKIKERSRCRNDIFFSFKFNKICGVIKRHYICTIYIKKNFAKTLHTIW
jgi:hypothetical protein